MQRKSCLLPHFEKEKHKNRSLLIERLYMGDLQTTTPLWNKVTEVAASIPLFVRVVMLLPAVFSTSTLLLGFVALTTYTYSSGFNFLKYLTPLDIATVGTSILLFWYGPLILLFTTVGGLILIFLKRPEQGEVVETNAVEAITTRTGTSARALAIGWIMVLILTALLGTLASRVHYAPSDRIDLPNSNTTYGENFLNSSNYIVARTSSSFQYDPLWEEEGGEDGAIEDVRPSIRAELVVIPKEQVKTEYIYITSTNLGSTQSPTDDFTASFRGFDNPIPWYQRVLKAPFR